jgi:hypothetical protein
MIRNILLATLVSVGMSSCTVMVLPAFSLLG